MEELNYRRVVMKATEFEAYCPDCENPLEIPIPHEDIDGTIILWPEDKYHKCERCGALIEVTGIRIESLEKEQTNG